MGYIMTVSEFKIWLEGVMAFQEANWKPTAKQWDLIFQKIKDLQDGGRPQQFAQQHPAPYPQRPLLQEHPQYEQEVVRIPAPQIQPLDYDPSLVPKMGEGKYVSEFDV
jgi:hypothetical protein